MLDSRRARQTFAMDVSSAHAAWEQELVSALTQRDVALQNKPADGDVFAAVARAQERLHKAYSEACQRHTAAYVKAAQQRDCAMPGPFVSPVATLEQEAADLRLQSQAPAAILAREAEHRWNGARHFLLETLTDWQRVHLGVHD